MRAKKIKIGMVDCTKEDLFFPVELRKEEMPSNKEYSMKVVGQINGSDFLLNQCSDVYTLVENENIFPKIEDALNVAGIEFEVSYRHINHVRFYADYKITDERYAYNMHNTNDFICPMISVQHSYNGLTKYKIVFGYFRFVCTNGMTVPVAEMNQFNLVIVGKHTDSIEGSFKRLESMLEYFVNDAELILNSITAKYEAMNQKVFHSETSFKERLEEVLEASKITMVDNNKFNTVNDILDRIETEANDKHLGYKGQVTDFLIYNGINQYLNDNDRNIMTPEVRMEKDSKVLEYMLAN